MKVKLIPAILMGAMLAQCSSDVTAPRLQPRDLSKTEAEVAGSSNLFGARLLRKLNEQKKDSNVFISPLSVSMALGMTLNGARGATMDSMAASLGFKGMEQADINAAYRGLMDLMTGLDPQMKLQIANSIWHRPELDVRKEFTDLNKENFNAEVRHLNFSDPGASGTINAWVAANTGDKIKKIVPDGIPAHIVMYLINAVYFKGTWSTKFDPKKTSDAQFRLFSGETVPCRMMHRHDTIPYARGEGYQMVDLDYGNGAFSMRVVVPDAKTDANALVPMLEDASSPIWSATMRTTEMDLMIPRFKIEFGKKLNDDLKALGMAIAFSSSTADLSGIGGVPGELYIDEVQHKSFIEVNEEGTEAAAATSVAIGRTSLGTMVRADRPFLFIIREKRTGTVLFVGKVANPGA